MTLINQLNTLESTGLVRLINAQPNVEYIFRHALIHDAVHDSLVKNDRTALHRLVGETLEQLYPDRLNAPDLAPMLAFHFDQGHDHQRASLYYTLSADAAYETFANQEAIAYYMRVIELADHASLSPFQLLHVFTRRGRAQEFLGQYQDALKNYQDMETAAQARGDRLLELNALILQATVHVAPTPLRDHAVGEELSNRALQLARELNDRPAEAKILWNLLLLHRHSGNAKAAKEYGEQSIAISRKFNLREQLAFVLNDLQPVYLMFGERERGRAALREAQQLWREDGNLPMLADSLSTDAMMTFLRGEYYPSLTLAQEAQELSEKIGNVWNQSYSRYSVGYIYLEHGEYDQALEIMDKTVRLGEQAGFIFAQIQTQSDLGYVYAMLGDYDHAFTYGRRALAVAEESLPQTLSYPLILLAYASYFSGDQERAADYLSRAAHDYSIRESNLLAFFTPVAEAEIACVQGDYQRVIEIADQAMRLMNALSMQPFRSDVFYFKALAFQELGNTDEAVTALTQATDLAQRLNSVRSLWQINALWADIEQARGNKLEAFKYRTQARESINFIAAHISDAKLQNSFLNLPKVRQASAGA